MIEIKFSFADCDSEVGLALVGLRGRGDVMMSVKSDINYHLLQAIVIYIYICICYYVTLLCLLPCLKYVFGTLLLNFWLMYLLFYAHSGVQHLLHAICHQCRHVHGQRTTCWQLHAQIPFDS